MAYACGGFFCQQVPIDQAGEQIIFRQDGDLVTAVVLIQYVGPAEDFSWVVPVPGIPEVTVGSDLVFAPLELATRPQFNLEVRGEECPFVRFGLPGGPVIVPPGLDFAGEAEDGVTILERFAAGPFDITVVSSDDPAAMAQWLEDNNYDLSDRGEELIAPYVAEGMNFVAVRLRQDQGVGDIQPLIMRYRSDKPMIPIRLTAVAALPDMGIIAWILGDARAVPTNYLSVEVNYTRLDWFNGPFAAFASYQDLVTEAMDEAGGQGFATDYAGSDLEFVSQLPDPEAFRDELARLDALVNLDEFYVQVFFNAFFTQSKVLEILRRELPLPVGLGEFAYGAPEVLFAQLDLQTIAAAKQRIVDELRGSVIEPLEEIISVFEDKPFMTRLFTTLSPEEMTLDPEFTFNPQIAGQGLERQAFLTFDCVAGTTQWELELGSGTGREGEVVMRGLGQSPLFSLPPVIEQFAVASAARLDATGDAELVTVNAFETATIGTAPPLDLLAQLFQVCGQGIVGGSLVSMCCLYLLAVSHRRTRRSVETGN